MSESAVVFRIGKNAHISPAGLEYALGQRKALPEMFQPSGDEERLSVWVEELTIADQAWAFTGCKPANTVVACLTVDKIRAIVPPDHFASLDVQWERALTVDDNGNVVPNTAPGAEGHVGIANLTQGGGGKLDKLRRLNLRSQLADIATISPVPVPHDIPEDHLRVAAYHISQKDTSGSSPQAHWVKAIRQMRRHLVQQLAQRTAAG